MAGGTGLGGLTGLGPELEGGGMGAGEGIGVAYRRPDQREAQLQPEMRISQDSWGSVRAGLPSQRSESVSVFGRGNMSPNAAMFPDMTMNSMGMNISQYQPQQPQPSFITGPVVKTQFHNPLPDCSPSSIGRRIVSPRTLNATMSIPDYQMSRSNGNGNESNMETRFGYGNSVDAMDEKRMMIEREMEEIERKNRMQRERQSRESLPTWRDPIGWVRDQKTRKWSRYFSGNKF